MNQLNKSINQCCWVGWDMCIFVVIKCLKCRFKNTDSLWATTTHSAIVQSYNSAEQGHLQWFLGPLVIAVT